VERPERRESVREYVALALAATEAMRDVWLFSSADAIGTVLSGVFGEQPSDQRDP
jgi:hypothetical protein